jgi:multiple sugar transport system permease protein
MNARAAGRPVAGTRPPRRRLRAPSRAERRNLVLGLLFISPWLVGFICFYLYPALASFYYSFTDFRILQDPTFVGLDNYRRLVADPFFWKSLTNTLYLAVLGVPLAIVTALGIALLLNARGVRGIGIFRTIFYLPVVVPSVAAAILWIWLLNPQYGLVNELLKLVGIDGPKWFYDPGWAKNGIILMTVWAAGDVVIIYLGALQGVSRTLYEAAEVDGAGPIGRFFNITVPLMTPYIFLVMILQVIGSFQVFTQALVMTEGGPAHATTFVMLVLYWAGWQWLRMGYASAIAWVLMAVIMTMTVLQFMLARRWVYYEGEVKR